MTHRNRATFETARARRVLGLCAAGLACLSLSACQAFFQPAGSWDDPGSIMWARLQERMRRKSEPPEPEPTRAEATETADADQQASATSQDEVVQQADTPAQTPVQETEAAPQAEVQEADPGGHTEPEQELDPVLHAEVVREATTVRVAEPPVPVLARATSEPSPSTSTPSEPVFGSSCRARLDAQDVEQDFERLENAPEELDGRLVAFTDVWISSDIEKRRRSVPYTFDLRDARDKWVFDDFLLEDEGGSWFLARFQSSYPAPASVLCAIRGTKCFVKQICPIGASGEYERTSPEWIWDFEETTTASE